jgi:pimeloyl-ACP methyl ester carboxylesterase
MARERAWSFIAGTLAGLVTGALATWAARDRRRPLDASLVRALSRGRHAHPLVVVPGLMGSQLRRPDGTTAWLNFGNALGHHDLSLPRRLPFSESQDGLTPGPLIGTDAVLPRVFGFAEYADLVELLEGAGFKRGLGYGPLRYVVYAYDWRRELVESARGLGEQLEAVARGRPQARFHLLGHSMGGLVIRYFLRYGGAEPGGPVTWEGTKRVASAVLVATPSGGALPALGAILQGSRVGMSFTTLAASVVARMPSVYELLPATGTRPLLDANGTSLDADLLDPGTWERFGWRPFGPPIDERLSTERAFVKAALARARAFHGALARPPETPCPVPVTLVGGDCLPTLARAVAGEGPPGQPPRFQPKTLREQELMYEAGDGRVTRASVLASHLPAASEHEPRGGLPEASRAYFGAADHHSLYADPAFQSLLLRVLLGPPSRSASGPTHVPAGRKLAGKHGPNGSLRPDLRGE